MLVFGGTPEPNSNRMKEDAFELQPCLLQSCYDLLQNAIKVKNISAIHDTLVVLSNRNINIVGSRGYVYQTKKLAEILLHTKQVVPVKLPIGSYNVFPRTMGLRKAIYDSIESKN